MDDDDDDFVLNISVPSPKPAAKVRSSAPLSAYVST